MAHENTREEYTGRQCHDIRIQASLLAVEYQQRHRASTHIVARHDDAARYAA